MRIFLLLVLVTLGIYGITHTDRYVALNYFVPLANAFIHGHLYLIDNPSWLNELIKWQGHYYVVYPPMPAILLIPFVALFGEHFTNLVSLFL